jgi:hypothetical protein
MKATKIQMRGHCQVCGAQQAAVRGGMSKHGYSVKDGWFVGICSGEHHAPVEQSRQHLDLVCADISKQVAEMTARIENLRTGVEQPSKLPVWDGREGKYHMTPVAEMSSHERETGLNTVVWELENRVRAGSRHVEDLIAIANKFHGQPLVEVDTQANKPEPIVWGEQRVNESGRTLTCTHTDGGRVYWTGVDYQGRPCKSWMGSRSWRAMSKA